MRTRAKFREETFLPFSTGGDRCQENLDRQRSRAGDKGIKREIDSPITAILNERKNALSGRKNDKSCVEEYEIEFYLIM